MVKMKMKMKTQKSMLVALSLMLLMTSASFGLAYEVAGVSPAGPGEEDKARAIREGLGDKDIAIPMPLPVEFPAFVSLYLYPEKQFAGLGEWRNYELVIKDNHLPVTCEILDRYPDGDSERVECPDVLRVYEYKLYYEAEEGILIDLNQDSVTLSSGDKVTIKFSVKSENNGANYFAIMVSGEEGVAGTKGVLVIGEKLIPPRVESSFFGGDGFAISEDGARGVLVNIKLLKYGDNELRGKFHIDGRTFDARGEISGNIVKLSLEMVGRNYPPYETNDRGIFKEAIVSDPFEGGPSLDDDQTRRIQLVRGTFVGTVSEYGAFSLLEGELSVGDMSEYKLTATSKKVRAIRDIPVEQEILVSVNQMLVLDSQVAESSLSQSYTGDFSEDDVYIRPYRVRAEKILWIFPTGKKILEVEVIRGDKVSIKKIREMRSERIDGYNVGVGSLDDEDNIELIVEKIVEE